MLTLDPKWPYWSDSTQTSCCVLIDRTKRNAIAKLDEKIPKEFCEIGKNIKIGIFGLILVYISVSRHDIEETKKSLGPLAQAELIQ